MNMRFFIERLALLSTLFFALSVQANNISLSSNTYGAQIGETIEVTITYDATDFAIFGGGFDLIYDPNTVQFMSYTQAESLGTGYHQNLSTFQGDLVSPGDYRGAFLGSFDLHNGIFNAGEVGTFVFTVLNYGGDGGCGASLCLNPTVLSFGSFTSLDDVDVTDTMFANGIRSATVVPVPAAIWLLLSGVGLLFTVRSRSDRK